MKTNIFEPKKTKVLLIGVSKYTDDSTIQAIPNVKRNIVLMKKMFLSNQVLNITEDDIFVSMNESKTDIERKLMQVSREAANVEHTLIVYYAGHGIVSTNNYKTYLTASNSTNAFLESDGISISNFKEFIDSSRAGRKIVILDACHSGAIHNAMNSTTSQFQSEINSFTGTYIMSSSSQNEPSLYSAEDPTLPTYFTGKLIETVKNGISNSNRYLTLRDIFETIYQSFKENGNLPLPQQSGFQNADKMVFDLNTAFIPQFQTENSDEDQFVIRLKKTNSIKYYLMSKLISALV